MEGAGRQVCVSGRIVLLPQRLILFLRNTPAWNYRRALNRQTDGYYSECTSAGPEPATKNYDVPMNERFKVWLKRVGWLGFLFFLIKGLLWLIIPYLIAKGVFSK